MNGKSKFLAGFILGVFTGVVVFMLGFFFFRWFAGDGLPTSGDSLAASASPQAPPTQPPELPASPTPRSALHLGEGWSEDGLDVAVVDAAVEWCYLGEEDANVCARDGASYLWVQIRRSNSSPGTAPPISSCFRFALHYEGQTLHPLEFVDAKDQANWFGGGCAELQSGSQDEGWVYFEVPEDTEIQNAMLEVERYQGPHSNQTWMLVEAD